MVRALGSRSYRWMLKKLSLAQIRNYSICPNFSAFSKDSFPVSFRLKIIEKVIKSSYLQMMETGFKVDWRRIVGWVDTLVIRGVEGDISHVKREAEVILVFLQKWYDKDYIVNQELGYVDLELEASVLHSVIEERISLVRVPGPSLLLLGDKPLTDTQLYNNIYYRGLAWLVYNSISCSEVILFSSNDERTSIMFNGIKLFSSGVRSSG